MLPHKTPKNITKDEFMVYYQYMSHSLTRSESVYSKRNPNGDPFQYDPEKNSELNIIGLILWATEGDRTQITLANGNPSIIALYLRFLREICNFREERIKAVIHCHDTLPYDTCIQYWSHITSIPQERFTKPFIKKDSGGTRKYPYGIIRIVANNVKLLRLFNDRLQKIGIFRD